MAKDKTFKTRAPSGGEMREELTARLPAIKAKVKERALKAKTGRPTTYTEEIGEEIYRLMSEGYSVTEACDALNISRGTVYHWKEKNPAFDSLLARAREALAEFAFSEAYAIPKKLLALYDEDKNNEVRLDPARVQAARLATNTLQWYAERLAPKTFGERKAEAPSLTINNNSLTVDSRSLTPEQREALRGALLAAKAIPLTIEGEPED
jgi:hypothetical protein